MNARSFLMLYIYNVYMVFNNKAYVLMPYMGTPNCLIVTVDTFLEYESDQQCDDGKVVEEKNATLRLALSQLVVDFDRDSNLCMNRFFSNRWAPVIPTGSLKLDHALGIGGLPKVIMWCY